MRLEDVFMTALGATAAFEGVLAMALRQLGISSSRASVRRDVHLKLTDEDGNWIGYACGLTGYGHSEQHTEAMVTCLACVGEVSRRLTELARPKENESK